MAKTKKKQNQEDKNYMKWRLGLISLISIALIASIIWAFNGIEDAKMRIYEGLTEDGMNHTLSDIDNSNFFIDDYYFRGYEAEGVTYKRGIDVSEHQGEINWEEVKAAGVDFAFIRLGFRTSDKGVIKEDARFRENIEGAKANGIQVGVYFFSQAIDVDEAIDEAAFTARTLKNYDIDLAVAFDMEEVDGFKDRIAWLSKSEVTEITDAFCSVIKNYGYDALVYTNPSWADSKLNLASLSEWGIWLAHYSEYPGFPYMYEIWQYSNTGKVDGISQKVDLDIMFVREE